jgi:Pyridoxamine 5'-phosphate oxidase
MPTTGAAELTARAIIDANLYLVLATADGTGRPWSSPVYFAHNRYAEFLFRQGSASRNSAQLRATAGTSTESPMIPAAISSTLKLRASRRGSP